MKRRCDGNDPNLLMCLDPITGERQRHYVKGELLKPCDCGRVFDDVMCSTVYPHRAIAAVPG